MKNRLLIDLEERIVKELSIRNPINCLKKIDANDLLNTAVIVLYTYRRGDRSGSKPLSLSEIATAIGKKVQSAAKMKKDSSNAAKIGAFVLYSFEKFKIISMKLGAGTNGHCIYMIEVLDHALVEKLWEMIPIDKIEKLPAKTPYTPWETSSHPCGASLVKTCDKGVLSALTIETHPIVFSSVNKAQEVGWKVNAGILPLVAWALRNKADAFADIWEIHNNEARQSKLRETAAVSSIAKRFIGVTFYH
jgi:hypothetical protein